MSTSPGGTSRVHSAEDREAWIAVQRKTFTRWVNQYVPADSKIESLVTDLADGTVLAMVLERISDEKVGRINKNPKIDIQKLENINQSLDFIRKHDIPLVNIGSTDVMRGNEKLILGLVFSLVLRFEVVGADGKQGLLLWLQRSTKGYPGVDVQDFTTSWKDGLAFNALIHRYRPDLLNFDELSAADAMGNCEKAFAVADEQLGINRLLDPEDVVAHPDEKSQVAYLSQFFKKFAGLAKMEAKLKAIKNAVEVTRRHDEWISQYEEGSKAVMAFAEENKARLGQPDTSSTTEEVKAGLDAFSSFMKTTKPEMASKRAETESILTTLVSSKRNNARPEFAPTIEVAAMTSAWEEMEQVERNYERTMLDKYLAFQRADHAAAKFKAKSATVNAWLDEKIAFFGDKQSGNSVPEIEAQLEIQTSFENRFKLYESVMAELQTLVAIFEPQAVAEQGMEGHTGVGAVTQGMADLAAKMESCRAMGAEHRAMLEAALAAEKDLVEKEKTYLQRIDQLDFTVDQLEERANEEIKGVTIAEIQDYQASIESFEQDLGGAAADVAEVSVLAAEIASKRPDAVAHCEQQQARLTALEAQMGTRKQTVLGLLEAEQAKDKLKQSFAEKANALADYLGAQRVALGDLTGGLEQQQAAVAKLREDSSGDGSQGVAQLEALGQLAEECDAAQIVANPYTSHTIYSLRSEHEQLLKALRRADDALSSQLMAQKALEIPPEQLKDIQEIFAVFDQDRDGKLRLADLREACLGAGIDLEDAELEKRMRARSANMLFTLDDFTQFFIDEIKTGDSKDDVVDAFKAISSTGTVSAEQIQASFSTQKDIADYLTANIADGNYEAFAEQLFTR
ncbi:Alpha-actinin-4 (Non-muscle alpha-actinin 4) [Durusdinium trenchii]|uniref:Alpha-actinin-4 (Non-muscle alpha-actinin 4) n=1 Tax=Durusdinium trenchii TaxID=1381693 RepID=A0ABP0L201_9DINO